MSDWSDVIKRSGELSRAQDNEHLARLVKEVDDLDVKHYSNSDLVDTYAMMFARLSHDRRQTSQYQRAANKMRAEILNRLDKREK